MLAGTVSKVRLMRTPIAMTTMAPIVHVALLVRVGMRTMVMAKDFLEL